MITEALASEIKRLSRRRFKPNLCYIRSCNSLTSPDDVVEMAFHGGRCEHMMVRIYLRDADPGISCMLKFKDGGDEELFMFEIQIASPSFDPSIWVTKLTTVLNDWLHGTTPSHSVVAGLEMMMSRLTNERVLHTTLYNPRT